MGAAWEGLGGERQQGGGGERAEWAREGHAGSLRGRRGHGKWPGAVVHAVRLLRTMSRRSIPFALVLPLVAGCDGVPLQWEPAAPVAGEPLATWSHPPIPAAAMPVDARGIRCDASLRLARRAGTDVMAAWWVVRPDSTAVLLAARGNVLLEGDQHGRSPRRVTGATWEPALPVDTLDRGTHGCARPAPAIVFEPRTGYVHVSYAMDAPEGTGVFFAHSMDAGRMWHSPVSIVYGPRLAATAIAARGDTVAIAYEDPNSADPPQVALALSVTAGHIFEHKSIPVSAGAHAAVGPEVAFEASGAIVAGWRERRPDGEVAMRRRATWAR